MTKKDTSPKASGNATTEHLETLNGLLANELIRRIQTGEANSSDLNAAVRLLAHNRVAAENPEGQSAVADLSDIDFPFK